MINQRRNAKISNLRSDIGSSTLNDTESIDLQRQLLPPFMTALGNLWLNVVEVGGVRYQHELGLPRLINQIPRYGGGGGH
jgi:hypothetical protein